MSYNDRDWGYDEYRSQYEDEVSLFNESTRAPYLPIEQESPAGIGRDYAPSEYEASDVDPDSYPYRAVFTDVGQEHFTTRSSNKEQLIGKNTRGRETFVNLPFHLPLAPTTELPPIDQLLLLTVLLLILIILVAMVREYFSTFVGAKPAVASAPQPGSISAP